jgi:hypothetical protein
MYFEIKIHFQELFSYFVQKLYSILVTFVLIHCLRSVTGFLNSQLQATVGSRPHTTALRASTRSDQTTSTL